MRLSRLHLRAGWLIAVPSGVALLLAAGCGSNTSGRAPVTLVSTRRLTNPSLGGKPALVDGRGFTLYEFSRDPVNTLRSHCRGACASVWRPLAYAGGALVAAGSALGSEMGAISAGKGSQQVAYAGHPLYTYSLDKKPGDAVGNGVTAFGGRWYALGSNGRPVSAIRQP